jgi:hypothetical protein
MLDPQKNRIDYGEQLIPPNGYALDYAVGTTYSLDLEALMVLPVALFYSTLLDTSTEELRYDMVDAIFKASDKITVYCQKGKIKVPKKYHSLMAHWEKGIEEIQPASFESSFHPKVWVVRCTAQNKPAFYRFLVTSRNMTFAHDWDTAFSTEGYVGAEEIEKSRPLADFMRFLSKSGKRPIPDIFIKELSRVEFAPPDGYKLMNIYPLGLDADKNNRYQNALLKKRWERLLAITPFIDDGTLKKLAERSDVTILSRKDELDFLNEQNIKAAGEDKFFQFSRFIYDAESLEDVSDGQGEDPRHQDIHAKIFIGELNGATHWFLGSANGTGAAFERNIEMMVELKTTDPKYFPRSMVALLTDPKGKNIILFDRYDLNKRDDQATLKSLERDLRKIIYDVSALTFSGQLNTVKRDGGDLFDVTIECDASGWELKKGFEVRIKPLPERDKKAAPLMPGQMNRIMNFKGHTEIQLSPFLEVEVWSEGSIEANFIVRMEIELPESRLRKIFSSIIDSREKFMQYLAFLLSGEDAQLISTSKQIGETNSGDQHGTLLLEMPVFEKLLLAASRNPVRIRSVDEMIQRIQSERADGGEPIVSDEFIALWNVFKTYMEEARL